MVSVSPVLNESNIGVSCCGSCGHVESLPHSRGNRLYDKRRTRNNLHQLKLGFNSGARKLDHRDPKYVKNESAHIKIDRLKKSTVVKWSLKIQVKLFWFSLLPDK